MGLRDIGVDCVQSQRLGGGMVHAREDIEDRFFDNSQSAGLEVLRTRRQF